MFGTMQIASSALDHFQAFDRHTRPLLQPHIVGSVEDKRFHHLGNAYAISFVLRIIKVHELIRLRLFKPFSAFSH